ncbi:DUF4398 domain-containing protein [Stutzerimonas stutzeri]|uniref:DUF4398 domain-containing protein n=1 Tax=Stutzerimonas stutzeri TaxID=316 RepID=UPI00210A563A|nr:DUF4398 domain-containing protein [Stutzerimonas stutzeri]MCQ4240665.1 DUF4398 domain-containing protein [Stutzerimonas stutzeri]
MLAMIGGCASDPAPYAQLKLSEQAVAQAHAVGVPVQAPELLMAQEKLDEARAAMDRGHYREARLQAEQAELDARLAEARVLNEKSQLQLLELNGRIARLREQLGAVQ